MSARQGEHRFPLRPRDGIALEVRRWSDAAQAPRAVLVVAHGMGEHADRYRAPLMPIIAAGVVVYALDHRGHGERARLTDTLGDYGPGGFAGVVSDLVALVEMARGENPGVPLILLGHSMGSMIAQAFVLDHADLIDALVLSGSGAVDVIAAAGAADPALFAALNTPFEPGRTGFEWLSRDEREVDLYCADPLCGFALVPESFGDLFGQGVALADASRIAAIPKDLPIWIASGDEDPLYSMLGAVEPLIDRYRAAGLTVDAHIYPGARHEILNEINRDEVVADLHRSIDAVIVR
ncbi:alpha/beta fold hydrolase [Sphingopyxis sp.]|uniref:alpha/beta fold hydrolase n=1 Tax=Sphingopyxis sp. TaxID=1908224 RepID=UPI003D126CA5